MGTKGPYRALHRSLWSNLDSLSKQARGTERQRAPSSQIEPSDKLELSEEFVAWVKGYGLGLTLTLTLTLTLNPLLGA